jgi:integrase
MVPNKGPRPRKNKKPQTPHNPTITIHQIQNFSVNGFESPTHRKTESKVLPVFSNQKLSAYLKKIQMMARLKKNLTFHVARLTFATTVTMTNGMPIESVAKMMGHKNIKTTQHYARIVDSKINNDLIDLANRIGTKFSFAI